MEKINQQNTQKIQKQIKHKGRLEIIEERLDALEQKVGIPSKTYDCTCGCGIPYPPKKQGK